MEKRDSANIHNPSQKPFQRRATGQMSSNGNNHEYTAAVAAATYAINTMEPGTANAQAINKFKPRTPDQRIQEPRRPLEPGSANAQAINKFKPRTPDQRIQEPRRPQTPPLERLKSKADEAIPAIAESARRLSKKFTERFLRLTSEDEDQFEDAADKSPEKPKESPSRNVPEEKTIHPIPSPKRTPTFSYSDEEEEEQQREEERKKRMKPEIEEDAPYRPMTPPKRPFPPIPRQSLYPIPSPKRTPTFSYSDEEEEEQQREEERKKRMKPEIEEDAPYRPMTPPKRPPPPIPRRPLLPSSPQRTAGQHPHPPLARPLLPSSSKRTSRQQPTRHSSEDKGKQKMEVDRETDHVAEGIQRANREADAWERAELARIKDKYETLHATIREWEEKKAKKATRKVEKIEEKNYGKVDFERKRAKAMANYKEDMERIREIADGARAQAKQKQRKDELKAREKANKIRTTGELPTKYCICF